MPKPDGFAEKRRDTIFSLRMLLRAPDCARLPLGPLAAVASLVSDLYSLPGISKFGAVGGGVLGSRKSKGATKRLEIRQ